MISGKLQGGLGNQMFQIAASAALAMRNNDEFCYDLEDHYLPFQGKKADNYVDNIFRKIVFSSDIDKSNIYKESKRSYSKIAYSIAFLKYFSKIAYSNNLFLVGYFQSEKYFSDKEKEIRYLFSIDSHTENFINEKYGRLLTKRTTSIHIRRKDYLKFKDIHPVCKKEYYLEAIKYLPEAEKYLIFSDDIEWCRENFRNKCFKIISGEKDYIDLFLMSYCDNNIIANSSFSWWGAWLNSKPDKRIVAPKAWFGPGVTHDTRDIIPNGWKII